MAVQKVKYLTEEGHVPMLAVGIPIATLEALDAKTRQVWEAKKELLQTFWKTLGIKKAQSQPRRRKTIKVTREEAQKFWDSVLEFDRLLHELEQEAKQLHSAVERSILGNTPFQEWHWLPWYWIRQFLQNLVRVRTSTNIYHDTVRQALGFNQSPDKLPDEMILRKTQIELLSPAWDPLSMWLGCLFTSLASLRDYKKRILTPTAPTV